MGMGIMRRTLVDLNNINKTEATHLEEVDTGQTWFLTQHLHMGLAQVHTVLELL